MASVCGSCRSSVFRVDDELVDKHRRNSRYDTAETPAALRDIVSEFGFQIDLSLYQTIYEEDQEEFIRLLRREVEAIGYQTRYKGSKDYYDFVFSKIRQIGFTYSMFSDVQGSIYRALLLPGEDGSVSKQLETLPTDISNAEVIPRPANITFGAYIQQKTLDMGNESLDSGWSLDSEVIGTNVSLTGHIACEYFADELFDKGGTQFLATKEHFKYLERMVTDYGRKATTIPHNGIGLTIIGNIDQTRNTMVNTNAEMQILAGYGNNIGLRSTPSDFYYEVETNTGYSKRISDNEISLDSGGGSFDVLNVSVPGRMFGPYTYYTYQSSDGVVIPGFTLQNDNVVPHTFILRYEYQLRNIEVVDNGNGKLYLREYTKRENESEEMDYTILSDIEKYDFCGDINYTTGEVSAITLQTSDEDLTPDNGMNFDGVFATHDNVVMNEIKIKASNGEAVLESVFPPVEFNSYRDHVSFLIVVDQR